MTTNYSWLIEILPPAVAAALAASIGAYFSARLGVVHAERAEASRLRRESADDLIGAFTALRNLLRDVQHDRDAENWLAAVNVAYDAIEDARYRLPPSFRHLKQSIRFALGAAVGGVSLADMQSTREQQELADYNYRWNEYAIEYIEMALDSIREWRDASVKTAPNVRLLAFDPWLAKSGRYVPGQDSAPSGQRRPG